MSQGASDAAPGEGTREEPQGTQGVPNEGRFCPRRTGPGKAPEETRGGGLEVSGEAPPQSGPKEEAIGTPRSRRGAQGLPRGAQGTPKEAQNGPRRHPRSAQGGRRANPRSAQGEPRGTPQGPQPGETQETSYTISGSCLSMTLRFDNILSCPETSAL